MLTLISLHTHTHRYINNTKQAGECAVAQARARMRVRGARAGACGVQEIEYLGLPWWCAV